MLSLVVVTGTSAHAQLLRVAEMKTGQIARLDTARTVFIIPSSVIEEHGPYLPVLADGYGNERIAADVAAAIVARPGWAAVILPMVPLGSVSFDQVAGRPGFPGSLSVRASTLCAVFMDLGDGLASQGFHHVFIVNGRGDSNHNRAMDLAGEYFRATHGGFMVHLLGPRGCQAESVGSSPATLFSAKAIAADAASPHAGAPESARTLDLRSRGISRLRVACVSPACRLRRACVAPARRHG